MLQAPPGSLTCASGDGSHVAAAAAAAWDTATVTTRMRCRAARCSAPPRLRTSCRHTTQPPLTFNTHTRVSLPKNDNNPSTLATCYLRTELSLVCGGRQRLEPNPVGRRAERAPNRSPGTRAPVWCEHTAACRPCLVGGLERTRVVPPAAAAAAPARVAPASSSAPPARSSAAHLPPTCGEPKQ
jgi:hypothetical protein